METCTFKTSNDQVEKMYANLISKRRERRAVSEKNLTVDSARSKNERNTVTKDSINCLRN